MRGLLSAYFFRLVACGVMEGLKNCFLYLSLIRRWLRGLRQEGGKCKRVAGYDRARRALHALA